MSGVSSGAPGRLAGRSGVVTGAASGLGREVALLFAREGANVIAADIDEPGAHETARAGGERVRALRCDVTREDDVANAVVLAREAFGGLDFMINNAGAQVEKSLLETTNEDWEKVFAVNARAVFWGCKYAVAAMRERGGGAIVNTASALSLAADALLPAYTASKHATLGLTRSVGIGYAADGIRCNCVCPADMDTPMVQAYFDASPDPAATRREVEAVYPGGRIATPQEVARVVLFLASDDSSFVNGSFVQVDGGLLSRIY
jgi:NAD(P)-dependent dehydrogenase (short-subunit alcohol dehydrogenase family)